MCWQCSIFRMYVKQWGGLAPGKVQFGLWAMTLWCFLALARNLHMHSLVLGYYCYQVHALDILILRVQCADYTTCATSVGQDTVCYSNFKACGEVQAILLRQCAGGFFGKASKAWSGVTAHWPLTIDPSKPWPYAGIFTHGYQVCPL
jgi:hypothetical protein